VLEDLSIILEVIDEDITFTAEHLVSFQRAFIEALENRVKSQIDLAQSNKLETESGGSLGFSDKMKILILDNMQISIRNINISIVQPPTAVSAPHSVRTQQEPLEEFQELVPQDGQIELEDSFQSANDNQDNGDPESPRISDKNSGFVSLRERMSNNDTFRSVMSTDTFLTANEQPRLK